MHWKPRFKRHSGPIPLRPKRWTCGSHERETVTSSEYIIGAGAHRACEPRPLVSVHTTRTLEESAAQTPGVFTLMERAGRAVAELALAIAPHARTIWIACGPGNNGGDGYEAAYHLKQWGKQPVVTPLDSSKAMPRDATASYSKAIDSGVQLVDQPPSHFDLCIDALFGIGRLGPWSERCASWITTMNASPAPVLAVDLPSGLDGDSGVCKPLHIRATHTLSLLTLKPGLFTADGREASGVIWFNNLGITPTDGTCAVLSGTETVKPRAHNTHKGQFGDVAVWGGARGMEGAARLAARAALHSGAGRVYIASLSLGTSIWDYDQPELMLRDPAALSPASLTVVAGCGGGTAIQAWLECLIEQSAKLVLDADALNVIAASPQLQKQLTMRPPHSTVLTPHPLEAARLMGMHGAGDVQTQRLEVAQSLADRFACVVALKGSGTIIAAPNATPHINPTGNGRLASAGTGDVLAGMIGARLAQGQAAFKATCAAVFEHGAIADAWPTQLPFTARSLISAVS